ncbi:MAG: hypothetical protein KJ077_11030 [Anaerolineae bacterium]|nr:hypothetical protein [Anaerolineae bacterium]
MQCGEATGRTNKKGLPCGCRLNGGKCPTHDVDVAARNSKVARAAAEREERRQALSEYGKLGYEETTRRYGPDYAYNHLVAWKRENLTRAEGMVYDFLKANKITVRPEYEVFNETFSSRVDFAHPKTRRFIQVDGWRWIPNAFGLDQVDLAREAARYIATWHFMENNGWQGLELRYDPRKQEMEAGWQETLLKFFNGTLGYA